MSLVLRHAVWLGASFLLLAGCADQRIRRESDRLMQDNHYEQAYELLEGGLKQYPDSMLLRSGSLQARNAALNGLLDDAASARAEGALDDAEALLQRAQRFDISGRRVSSLLAELTVERRQRAALAEAEDLASKKKSDAALRVLSEALKDNPRQPELLALQRRLQGEQRRAQVKATQLGLSETRPISLDFRDANLRTVLDVVTRNSGVNFVLDKDIKADVRVTVFLRSARVEDAIDLIVSTHQLAKKVIDAQTLLIYPNTPEKQREYQEQVVRVFYLANAEAKGAAAFLKSMLRSKDPFVDERSNMLALRDTPEMIEMAERLISLYDTADAEVVLELEVLEIRTNRLLELGVQFPDSLSLTPLAPSAGSGGSGGSGLTVSNLNRLGWDRVGVGVSGLLVNLKRQVGDVNTLANPRIRVRSKDKAKVLIGDKVPVVSATTGQTGFVSDSVSYLDVGLKLDVEPTVYSDDDVAIKIGLEVSSIAQQVTTKSGTLAYQIGTRSASTVLRLRDGETQLLAGLISRDERSSANRIPGLGDLPLAGRLFGSQRDEAVRTELVLAITPRVVRNMRRPEVSESELWVGTDASPRIRGVGGLVAKRELPEGAAGSSSPSPMNGVVGGLSAPAPEAPVPVSKPAVGLRLLGPGQARTGEVFTVALEMDSNAPVRGLPLQLKYSQAQLELLEVEEGEYFKNEGFATGFTKSVDPSAGVVKVGVLRNQAKGATGRGAVVRLKFKALRPGAGEVSLMSADPISLGSPLPPVPLPPLFRVQVQ